MKHKKQIELCLPVVTGKKQPLVFREWQQGDSLVEAGFGTQVPAPDKKQLAPD